MAATTAGSGLQHRENSEKPTTEIESKEGSEKFFEPHDRKSRADLIL
jgi:hypothetical protein